MTPIVFKHYKTLLLASGCTLGAMGAVHAQNESDAIRYSSGYWYGTARSMGVGGAVSTLGADASAITLNPAGLAQYRSSEFSSSLSFQNISNRASYINSVTRDARFNMNIPNLSLIIADQQYDGNKPRTEGWVNYAVGFGVNRSHDFHSRTFFRDTNNSSSVTDYFADRANGTLVDDMQEGSLERIAWDAYAMDAGSTNGTYLSPLLGGTRMLRQSGIRDIRGSINDWHLSLGTNYSNRLYLGLGLVYSALRYQEDFSLEERDLKTDPTLKDLRDVEFIETNNDRGGAVGARLGMILRANDNLRFGLGIQTPRSFSLTKTYTYRIVTRYDAGAAGGISRAEAETDPANSYTFKIVTPFKANLGMTMQFGKNGFIGADMELVDYTTSRLTATDYGFQTENANIRLLYRQVLNARIGGEWVIEKYRLRAGYMNFPNPFSNNAGIPFTRDLGYSAVTGGFGIREKAYFLDLALVGGKRADYYTPYSFNEGSPYTAYTVTNNYRFWNFVVTLGFRLE
ncbi:MAG: hypothetical protein ACOVSS_07790 [Bacteroidia bacterium]